MESSLSLKSREIVLTIGWDQALYFLALQCSSTTRPSCSSRSGGPPQCVCCQCQSSRRCVPPSPLPTLRHRQNIHTQTSITFFLDSLGGHLGGLPHSVSYQYLSSPKTWGLPWDTQSYNIHITYAALYKTNTFLPIINTFTNILP